MDLKQALEKIAQEYPVARSQPFADHPLANYIRSEVSRELAQSISSEEITVRASAGKGQWAFAPWIAFLDKGQTDGPQEGMYVAYLFSDDLQLVYLTLAQGVTRTIERHGRKDGFRRLQATAELVRATHPLSDFSGGGVALGTSPLSSAYEKSVIYAKEYSTNNLPDTESLADDLNKILSFYTGYLREEDVLTSETDFTSSVGRVEEGKRLLKQHYVRERNPKIIAAAKSIALKKHGELRCEVCSFSFDEHYGERARNYIEGHHRKSISSMKEGDTTAVEDIALLCSNCHRAIHAKWPYISVEELKTLYKTRFEAVPESVRSSNGTN